MEAVIVLIFPVVAYLLYTLSHMMHRREVARERHAKFMARRYSYKVDVRRDLVRPLTEVRPEHFNNTVSNLQVSLRKARARRPLVLAASDEVALGKKAA